MVTSEVDVSDVTRESSVGGVANKTVSACDVVGKASVGFLNLTGGQEVGDVQISEE